MTLVKTSTETENIKKGDRKNKKDQLEMKNAVTEMKEINKLDEVGIKSVI